jgi:cell division protein FtsZ
MGKAMMGTGEASGEKRAIEAAEAAFANPLLDDVSMRGGRGLLISITGGPGLTLYEVDEAATRIREEVDPEANIILGATFDETLEGTMRVSVVATGLNFEAETAIHEVSEPRETARLVYGFSGTRHSAPREPVEAPRPAAQAASMRAAEQPTPDEQTMLEFEDYEQDPYGDAAHEIVQPERQPVVADKAPRAQKMAPRMPKPDEFPALAQRQLAQRQAEVASIADQGVKRRRGLLERLASVGIGRRDEPMPAPQPAAKAEPHLPPSREAPLPAPTSNVHPIPRQIDPGLDDDQLEIPAFLRRQAN